MQITRLLPAAALAWSATAQLVPLTFEAQRETESGFVTDIPCGDCPEQADGSDTWLKVDFAVTADEKIAFGGVPIYPLSMLPDGQAEQVTAKQSLVDRETGVAAVTTGNSRIASRMDFSEKGPWWVERISATHVRVEVLAVEGKVVHVDTVVFTILEDENGRLSIYSPDVVASDNTPLDAACETLVCRVRAQIKAKIDAIKAKASQIKQGCMRKMGFRPHGAHRRPDGGADRVIDRLRGGPNKFAGKKPCPGKAGHGHGHGHRHHRGLLRKVWHLVVVFTHVFLMPAMIGMAAGMAVSAFCMVVAQLFFTIYMRLRGRRNGGLVAVYQIIESSDDADADVESLPAYDEKTALPPAYSDEKVSTEN